MLPLGVHQMKNTKKLTRHAEILFALISTAILTGCGGSSSSTQQQPPPPPSTVPDSRADAMLAQMTQDEKLQMVMGGVTTNLTYGYTVPQGAGGWVPGIPSLGIPTLYISD